MNIAKILVWVQGNWTTIIAGMVLADRVIEFIGAVTKNDKIDNFATMLGNLIAKIPQTPPKV